MKIFISVDIEGCAGISDWSEADCSLEHSKYEDFAEQMTAEASAAAEACLEFADKVVVRDAHGTARNMNPDAFPEGVSFIRNWSGDPRSMMDGLDESYDACIMIGYHSGAGFDGNPLAHTFSSSKIFELKINGERLSEAEFNASIAAYYGVPLIFLSGDEALCRDMQEKVPRLETFATFKGIGAATQSVHPQTAIDQIYKGVRKALTNFTQDKYWQTMQKQVQAADFDYEVEITYKDQRLCHQKSFYPGAEKINPRTLRFKSKDFYEVMRLLVFVV